MDLKSLPLHSAILIETKSSSKKARVPHRMLIALFAMRQIHNALTTARQLAQFKGDVMDFRHLKRAIKASAKFDQYLKNVQRGATDDDIAKDESVR